MSKKSYADLKQSAEDARKIYEEAKAMSDASKKVLSEALDKKIEEEKNLQEKEEVLKAAADSKAKAEVDLAADPTNTDLQKKVDEAKTAFIAAQTAVEDAKTALKIAEDVATNMETFHAPNTAATKAAEEKYAIAQKELNKSTLIRVGGLIGTIALVGFLITGIYMWMYPASVKEPDSFNAEAVIKKKLAERKSVPKAVKSAAPTVSQHSSTPSVAPTAKPADDKDDKITQLQNQVNALTKQIAKKKYEVIVVKKSSTKSVAKNPVKTVKSNPKKVTQKVTQVVVKKDSVTKQAQPVKVVQSKVASVPVNNKAQEAALKEDTSLQQTYQSQWEEAGRDLEKSKN